MGDFGMSPMTCRLLACGQRRVDCPVETSKHSIHMWKVCVRHKLARVKQSHAFDQVRLNCSVESEERIIHLIKKARASASSHYQQHVQWTRGYAAKGVKVNYSELPNDSSLPTIASLVEGRSLSFVILLVHFTYIKNTHCKITEIINPNPEKIWIGNRNGNLGIVMGTFYDDIRPSSFIRNSATTYCCL